MGSDPYSRWPGDRRGDTCLWTTDGNMRLLESHGRSLYFPHFPAKDMVAQGPSHVKAALPGHTPIVGLTGGMWLVKTDF